jgi:hypothetical protein
MDSGGKRKRDGRKTDFIATGVIVKLHRQVALADGSVGEGGQQHVDDDRISVDVELLVFGESKVCSVPLGRRYLPI